MNHAKCVSRGETGSISVFFCLIAALLVGAVSYSLFIGQQVEKRIALQNASDAGALAMANHASQGLNMISANNLAIGASLHVAASVSVLASYATVARLAFAKESDIQDLVSEAGDVIGVGTFEKLDVFQKEVWDPLAVAPALFLRLAVGVTSFNAFVRDYWLYAAPVPGIELTRANAPDAIAVPIQRSAGAASFTLPLMRYRGLKQTRPQDTYCHALKASRAMKPENRDNVMLWLSGPLKSLTDASLVNNVTDAATKVFEAVNKISLVRFGFMGCGYGLKSSLFSFFESMGDKAPDFAVLAALGLPKVRPPAADDPRAAVDWYWAPLDCGDLDIPCHAKNVVRAKNRLVAHANITYLSEAVRVQKAYLRAFFVRKGIEEMRADPRKYACEGRKGFLKVVGEAGVTCFEIGGLDPRCPVLILEEDNLSHGIGVVIDAAVDLKEPISAYIRDKCQTYKAWAATSKSSDGQSVADDGLEIVDFGKQASSMVRGLPRNGGLLGAFAGRSAPRVTEKDLGFLFPDPAHGFAAFQAATSFVNVAALPLRTTNHLPAVDSCPEGNRFPLSDGHEYCDVVPLVGMANLASDEALAALPDAAGQDAALRQLNVSQGGLADLVRRTRAEAGALRGAWARTQWVISESSVAHRPHAGDPRGKTAAPEMRTFWPAWQGELRPVDNAFAGGVLGNLSQDHAASGVMAALMGP